MFERIRSIIVKEFLQVLRDPRMRTVILISPLLQILLFGYAATTDINNIPTAVYDLDNTRESRDLIRAFTYSKYFVEKYYISTDEEQNDLMNRSLVSAVIRVNRGFARKLRGNKSAPVQVVVDGTDSNTANIVLGYAGRIVADYSDRALKERSAIFLEQITPTYPRIEPRDRAWFNENLMSKNYYIPGVMAMIVTIVSLLLTSMAIVREKEIGTMEQLLVSPIRPIELIAGKALPFAVIALVNITTLIMIAVFWFKVPLRGNLVLLFFSTLVYLVTTLGIGLFISTLSSTQQEASMSTFLIFFPMSLLSGLMFPINNMPRVVQYITYLNPMRYFTVILRGIFLKGVGIDTLWAQVLILAIMGTIVITFSSMRFQKQLG
ncbi:MAG: ABC transporter permease [Candidatus Omnitrophota bacterium]